MEKPIVKEIVEYLEICYANMPILNQICEGKLTKKELKQIALLHYAETKTFTNFKNLARIYLCPHEATKAKKYFCYLYREEQGNFEEGMNHADLLKPVCLEHREEN